MGEMTDKEKLLFAELKKYAARYSEWLKEINEEYHLQDHHKIVDDIARILGAIASPDEWDEERIKRWFS